MTKIDFVLIAAVLKDFRPIEPRDSANSVVRIAHMNLDDMAKEFADRLQFTNPRFDRSQFLRACGNEV